MWQQELHRTKELEDSKILHERFSSIIFIVGGLGVVGTTSVQEINSNLIVRQLLVSKPVIYTAPILYYYMQVVIIMIGAYNTYK